MQILVMGGTRFVGRPLVAKLLNQGHALTLFTRGIHPVPAGVENLNGDRSNSQGLAALRGRNFDVIVDSSGRTLDDSRRVLMVTGVPKHRFVYVSSAGVYAASSQWPLNEDSPTDPKSRHAGKADTEAWLRAEGIPFTSFRPTYIYGPGNYNPIERWFFDRIVYAQPVPLPGDGSTITQLGHVDDLAEAMARCIDVEAATNRIYNCSGKRGVTFKGLVRLAALTCGKDPNGVELRPFNPSSLDSKARKAFPLRLNHFFTDVSRAERELAWKPRFDLAAGLLDSYTKDYALTPKSTPDFSPDASLIGV
ncbi:NAD-dependent epimerase/dehydratase family protein [Synechococcus sp. M16CYN]|uniref:NAD-dependent epimerase/dehydratase family protein n=1 Tax=Synechococcus sp. M16CYN TaxID=3103139 RepID=UPI0032462D99